MADIVNPTGLESSRFLNVRHLAARLDLRPSTLKKWRLEGRGPGGWFHLSGNFVVYPVAEVEAWLAKQQAQVVATSHRGPGQRKRLSGGVVEGPRQDCTGKNKGQYKGKRAVLGPGRKT